MKDLIANNCLIPENSSLIGTLHLMEVNEEDYINNLSHTVKLIDRKYYQPIIVSKTAKIIDGDHFLSKGGNYISNCNIEWCHKHKYQKVLMKPDQFTEKQLQSIVNGELKQGDQIMLHHIK